MTEERKARLDSATESPPTDAGARPAGTEPESAGARPEIRLTGIRTHNLKGIDVVIPTRRLTVITGPSGSGKSSLAFDTLYAEGQRRYVESLSAYTRQFLERMDRPDVEAVSGIPPAIAVERRPPAKTSRSTVGTTTEILDYLRMLFARAATLRCLSCGREVHRFTTAHAADRLLAEGPGRRATVVFPLVRDETPQSTELLRRRGFFRLTRDGREIVDLHDGDIASDGDRPFYVVTDRLQLEAPDRSRLTESLEAAFLEGRDRAGAFIEDGRYVPLSRGFHCAYCDRAYPMPSPQTFSFNSPIGACPRCRGFGDIVDIDPDRVVPDRSLSLVRGAIAPWQSGAYRTWQRRLMAFVRQAGIPSDRPFGELTEEQRREIFEGSGGFPGVRGFFSRLEQKIYKLHVRVLVSRYRRYVSCGECGGTRLRPEALAYHIDGRSLAAVCDLAIVDALAFFRSLALEGQAAETAAPLLDEIVRRLQVMERAGLEYLSLSRPSRTLSGGEYQRILLSGALGSGLVGTLYVLDEPSVGLHARDGDRLLGILAELRDSGNTVVVVEHDREMIRNADHIIDLGPGAGEHGGRIVYQGTAHELLESGIGATADYLAGRVRLPAPARRDLAGASALGIRGAGAHNLRNVDVDIPLGGLVAVTGVSGSGKSTLVQETLYNGYRALKGEGDEGAGRHRGLTGLHHVSDVVLIDQSPIGRTPRSNPVTYMKAFDGIRKLLAETHRAAALGLTAGSFSFNVPGGRCETCEGAGQIRIEMQFLADLFVTCEACRGTRYQSRVLEVHYRGKTVREILDLTVTDAVEFFADTPPVARPMWHLREVGLGYLRLGQPATTLSGGEAQRLKIAHNLARNVPGRSLFILDEPTTGLHLCDIEKLLHAFERLIQRGNSILVVEHNLDLIARADWIIDLGPEGGARGGSVVATGPPESIARCRESITGRYLAAYLAEVGLGDPSSAPRPRRARAVRPRSR